MYFALRSLLGVRHSRENICSSSTTRAEPRGVTAVEREREVAFVPQPKPCKKWPILQCRSWLTHLICGGNRKVRGHLKAHTVRFRNADISSKLAKTQ